MKQLTLFDMGTFSFKCPYCGSSFIGEYIVRRLPKEMWQKFCDSCDRPIGGEYVQDKYTPINR